MAVTESALLGIACILTHSPATDPSILNGLTNEEVGIVEQMVSEKICVPEKLRKILEAGRKEADQGDTKDGRGNGNPTHRC